jgi:hypothetical protein
MIQFGGWSLSRPLLYTVQSPEAENGNPGEAYFQKRSIEMLFRTASQSVQRRRGIIVTAVLLLSVPAVLIFTRFLGAPVAHAQTQQCYTLASLQGTFTGIGNYGANLAIALGTRSYDGNGNFTGTFIINEPTAGSTTGARTIVPGTLNGTYTVNCNGTGQVNHTATTSAGATTAVDDFVITGAIIQNGQLVATAITDAQEAPSGIVPGGIFLTRTFTRLPIYY